MIYCLNKRMSIIKRLADFLKELFESSLKYLKLE